VLPNSPASTAGMKAGDTIVSITSGKKIVNSELYPETVQKFINESTTKVLTLELKDQKGSTREIVVSSSTTIVEGRKKKR
jgi:C-terminal processing protease CtpA/Prc